MADRSNFFIMQLFHEMKQRFPAIPDRVVSDCIRQNFNDKQICEAVLTVKNRNYSHRLFPSPHMSKMLPASHNEGVCAVGVIEASATESETESSRCDDDTFNANDLSVASETEDSEASKVVRKSAGKSRGTVAAASIPALQRTSTSLAAEKSDAQWSRTGGNPYEAFQVTSNFGPQLSQEGCGRGIGGGCCCRHAEDMDFVTQSDDGGGSTNARVRVPIRHSGTSASVLHRADGMIDGVGESGFLRDNLDGVSRNAPVTEFPPRSGAPPLMSVSVPGVRPPPSSHLPNLADLSTQTSNLNISTSRLGTEFESFKQLPERRTPREVDDSGFHPSWSQMPPTEPLSPSYESPYTYDPCINFVEQGFMDEPPVLPQDVEKFLFDVNYRLKAIAVCSSSLENEPRRYDQCGKGQTSTSSTVKVSASSPVSSPMNRKRANPSGLQPAPVFAGQSRFQGTKESPPSAGRPITPTDYPNASTSSTSSQLVETPLSYTTVNLTLMQPSSDPLPPIDIRSSVGDSSLTYTSASSYYPQQSFQSELEIRIGGGAGISSGSGYGPITSSWKSQPQPPPPSGKNLTPNPSPPAPQMRPSNQSTKFQVPTNRSGEKQHHSPQPTRRVQPERPRSLYRPQSPGNAGRTSKVSGSLPDVSKTRLFSGEHDRNSGISERQSEVQDQSDPRVRPYSSIPSSPATGLPPLGPSSSGHSPKDRSRVPGTTLSPSSIDHPRSTCADTSRCKALIMHQIERKNLLERELNREREKLETMREESRMMQKDLDQRQMRQRSRANLPVIQRVLTLRQEIQILQEECKNMTNEVDLHSDIPVPLGETDEEFYKNIYTGQDGWVLLPPYNAQSNSSQRHDNIHQRVRESRERRRENPLPPGMNIPGGIRGDGEGNGLGPGAGGEGPNWICSLCTFRNHPALDKCEQCEMPRIMLEGSQTQDIHIHVTHHNFPMRRVVHSWVV